MRLPADRSRAYLVRRAVDVLRERLMAAGSTAVLRAKCLWLGVRCGRGVRAYGPVILRSPAGGIEIGDGVTLVSSSWRCSASALAHPVRLRSFDPQARIVIEAGVGLNGTSITARSRTIRIGRDTMIGPDCMIMDSDFHVPWPPQARNRYDPDLDSDVEIGAKVWLGVRCIVLKGTRIGENCVVAAGSVVRGEFPPDSLIAGNPARVVRCFDEADVAGRSSS